MFVNRGVMRTDLEPAIASAGDIVTLSGCPDTIAVGDTLTLKSNPLDHPLETPPINPPTLSMEIGANTSPLSGKEGTIVASSRVRERLYSETDNNVTLSVTKSETDPERSVVHARGELQLGILIEQMRREGYERECQIFHCCCTRWISSKTLHYTNRIHRIHFSDGFTPKYHYFEM
jgi:GTP-binding protein